ncbi:MAG TPA: putative toxin-antitoxin system toxin component, PIN family [Thermomicrobiales bacterium]|nr:putative toxin-antitoxin system toxin component, PIN family [Thermomicrobiales bacterium]
MRAVFDANVYISQLLSRRPATSAVTLLLKAAATESFTLLFSPLIGAEVSDTIATRPDLVLRAGTSAISDLMQIAEEVAEVMMPPIAGPLPEIGRDRKDDYLIAHAVVAGADFLVSWDKDLLDLGQVEHVRIVTPGEMVRILREQGVIQE